MIVLTIGAILVVFLVFAVPALAMTQNGGYDHTSFGCLGFLVGFAMAIILLGAALVI